MNNETWQCILCEKMCIIPYENYKYILQILIKIKIFI